MAGCYADELSIPAEVGYKVHLSQTSPPQMPKMLDKAKDRLKTGEFGGAYALYENKSIQTFSLFIDWFRVGLVSTNGGEVLRPPTNKNIDKAYAH